MFLNNKSEPTKNQYLYNKLLSLEDNQDIDFDILEEDGYGYCELSINVAGSVNEQLLTNDYILGTIIASGSGGLNINLGGAPYVSTRSITGGVELFIPAGTDIDYEDIGAGRPNSITFTGTADIAPDCSGIFTITFNDLNDESPESATLFFTVCSGLDIRKSIYVTDDDVFTNAFRNISITIQGQDASFFAVYPSSATAPFNAEFEFTAINTNNRRDFQAEYVLTDGVNSTTGNLIGTVNYTRYASNPYYLDYLYRIPSNLDRSKQITLGHFYFSDTIDGCWDCEAGRSEVLMNDQNFVIDNPSPTNRQIHVVTLNNNKPGEFDIFSTGNVYLSLDTYTYNCCGFRNTPIDISVSATDPALQPFKTGIGPEIIFSGGSGNVENSYFIQYNSNSIAIIPRSTGLSLSSQDDNFYLYRLGQTGVVSVSHPSETQILDAVATIKTPNIILIRYGSSNNNIFYKYNTTLDTFTSVSFSSPINRILPLTETEYQFLIVSDTEAAIYNSTNNSVSAVTFNTSFTGLPANIRIMPKIVNDTCNIPRLRNLGRYYIFEDNYEFSGLNSLYPVELNIYTKIIDDNADTSRIASVFPSGYKLYPENDIVISNDILFVSTVNTGLPGTGTIIARHDMSNTIDPIDISISGDYRKASVLANKQILISPYNNTTVHYPRILDPYDQNVNIQIADITGNIDLVASNKVEFRTLLIDSAQSKVFVVNDLDHTVDELSLSGLLPMGEYTDIFVPKTLSTTIDQSHNFYLLPKYTYNNTAPYHNLVALSTTTTGPYSIQVSGSLSVDETVQQFEPIQITTGLIPVGSFSLLDDEFNGSVSIGFNPNIGDGSIFTVSISNNTGTIYVKSGIALDYETKNTYTGYITGIDPYVGGNGFIDTFVLNINDVDEKPISITISPINSGVINSNVNVTNNVQVATFSVGDIDDLSINNNIISIGGPDQNRFITTFDNSQQVGTLYLKAGTVLDLTSKPYYDITLVAAKSGYGFSTSADWRLYVTDNPPVSVVLAPNSISLPENYIVPSTGLFLSQFWLIDTDTNIGNFATLIGNNSSYFNISYNRTTNSGELRLVPNSAFDFETQPIITGLIAAGNTSSVYSATGIFRLNITDVSEPSGITVSPSIVYINENINTTNQTVKLADLRFTDTNITNTMVVYNLQYETGTYRSALDKFTIIDNITTTPEIHIRSNATFDYETQNRYDIIVSGRPSNSSTNLLGGKLIVIVRDINEPPIISFDPSSRSITDTTPTDARFKVCNIYIQDEQQSSVVLSLSGADASNFTIVPSSGIVSDPANSIKVGELYLNSGVLLDYDIKNQYIAQIVAIDSSGLGSTGNFILSINNVSTCNLSISSLINDVTCPNNINGTISLNIEYTGANNSGINQCYSDSPISVVWNNVPNTATIGTNGLSVFNIGTGTYSATIYGGSIPLTTNEFTVSSQSSLSLLQIIKENNACSSVGKLSVIFSGGVPPYIFSYGTSRTVIPSGSGFSATLNIDNNNISGYPTITDRNGCEVVGGYTIFDFPTAFSDYTYISQEPPLIHDSTLESYKFSVRHGNGPYEINIYHTTTGEKGDIAYLIDRYETAVIDDIQQLSETTIDPSGNTILALSNANPTTYYYDLGGYIHPGNYIFEFINTDGCILAVDGIQTANNIEPILLQMNTINDSSFDIGFHILSQPILDTLFIPYKMLLQNSELLSYISSLDEKSDIKIMVGDQIFERKVLNGTINCDNYSILNIKFLGIKNNYWFYTLPIYRGFDLDDQDIDILNEPIYLILNNQKIKIVTELNNNINTIKLLKGSILTTDENTAQFLVGSEIELFEYDQVSASFTSLSVFTNVMSTSTLYNKYVANNIFRINYLDGSPISQNISTNQISNITFDCSKQQTKILQYRKFLQAINNFNTNTADSLYIKTTNNKIHTGSITMVIAGGYDNYDISYRYYDQKLKTTQFLYKNNKILNDFTATSLLYGSYIVSIRDTYGNTPKLINSIQYDDLYASMVDYIINEMHTTPDAINFAHGDLIVNIYDLVSQPSLAQNPKPAIPGLNPTEPVEPVDEIIISINTISTIVSPNTTFTNNITIQTNPPKVKYTVYGPYGYIKTFDDRATLIQLPPGVYTIKGEETDLYNKYLYQDNREIFVTKNTNLLIDLNFMTYEDQTIIKEN